MPQALDRSRVVLDVRPGESLDLSGPATVEVLQKSGRVVRLLVAAPRDVGVKLRAAKAQPIATHDTSMAE